MNDNKTKPMNFVWLAYKQKKKPTNIVLDSEFRQR